MEELEVNLAPKSPLVDQLLEALELAEIESNVTFSYDTITIDFNPDDADAVSEILKDITGA